MKTIVKPYLFQMIIYGIQYWIIPNIITVYPSDFEKNIMILVFTTFFITTIMMLLDSCSLLQWGLSFFVYPILILLYHPNYVYGIGYGIFAIDWISILFISIIVFGVEVITWAVIKAIYLVLM